MNSSASAIPIDTAAITLSRERLWPALCAVATIPNPERSKETVTAARQRVIEIKKSESESSGDWRSFQARRRDAFQAINKTAAQVGTPL